MCEREVLTSDCIHREVALAVTRITVSLCGSPLKRGKGKKNELESHPCQESGKANMTLHEAGTPWPTFNRSTFRSRSIESVHGESSRKVSAFASLSWPSLLIPNPSSQVHRLTLAVRVVDLADSVQNCALSNSG